MSKKKGLINVARWMPQIRRVCSRQLVYDQLDALKEGKRGDTKARIEQIKKDIARIQS